MAQLLDYEQRKTGSASRRRADLKASRWRADLTALMTMLSLACYTALSVVPGGARRAGWCYTALTVVLQGPPVLPAQPPQIQAPAAELPRHRRYGLRRRRRQRSTTGLTVAPQRPPMLSARPPMLPARPPQIQAPAAELPRHRRYRRRRRRRRRCLPPCPAAPSPERGGLNDGP